MKKLPRLYKLYIGVILIAVLLLAILPLGCSCNCSCDSGVGGGWNPSIKIAYVYRYQGNKEIYVMEIGADKRIRITNDPNHDYMPAWSPDGSKIAFVTDRDGLTSENNDEIYVIDADGTNETRLTSSLQPTHNRDYDPRWSPDGNRIAFVSDRDGNDEIYVMDADGANQTRLTSDGKRDWGPRWSPDGGRIAFISGRDGTDTIYVMNADGTGQAKLVDDWSLSLSWSPDGNKIAYHNFSGEIYVVDADGTNRTLIAQSEGSMRIMPLNAVSWSPDGSKIAFEADSFHDMSNDEGDFSFDIYVIDADGTNMINITDSTERDDINPLWAPIGLKILFISRDGSFSDIYIMDADGENRTNVTNKAGLYESPAWSPSFIQY